MNDILVIGGTGKTGRRVARLLRADGLPVRTASRTAGDVILDLADPATWAAALDDVIAAYVMDPTRLGAGRIPAFVTEAVAAGVRRPVLLSAPGAEETGHPLWAAERAVRGSGAEWTILRPTWFQQNFSESFWRQGVLDGVLRLPTGDGRTPFVDAGDIAAVAVAALTGDRHGGRVYELAGPRALTFGEAAALIGAATGRTVRHVDVDPDDYIAHQVAAGVPPEAARLLTGLLVASRDSPATAPADGVQRALGRAPRSFEAYVTETAATGVWNRPA